MDSEGYRGVIVKTRFLLALTLAFGSVFFAIPAQADPIATVWENSPIGVYLPEGVTFSTVSGWYGAPDDPNCGVDVSNVLTALAVGQNHFDIVANNSLFGDPCGGVYKVLNITDVTADWSQQIVPSPVEQPTPEPSQIVTPEPTPEAIASALPTPEPTPETTATPTPEPIPEPIATSQPIAPPVDLTPAPIPFPVEPPAPVPSPEPVPAPQLTAEPAPPTAEPAPPVAPSPEPVAPAPVATPAPIPAPIVVITPPPIPEPVKDLTTLDPQSIDPKTLTSTQVAQLTAIAETTLATEPQGSPAYNQALDQLMVVAQADDPQVPAELASIPLLGNAAVAVLDAFNNLGNIGSDMSPKQRKVSKKEAIATIAVGTATTASTVAAAGSVGFRRKETK